MPYTLDVFRFIISSHFGLLHLLKSTEHWGVHLKVSHLELLNSICNLFKISFALLSGAELHPLVKEGICWSPILARLEIEICEGPLKVTFKNLFYLLTKVESSDVVLVFFINHHTIIHHDLLSVLLLVCNFFLLAVMVDIIYKSPRYSLKVSFQCFLIDCMWISNFPGTSILNSERPIFMLNQLNNNLCFGMHPLQIIVLNAGVVHLIDLLQRAVKTWGPLRD